MWLFTDFDVITEYRFPKGICNGCGMPTGDAYSSGHLVLSHFGTCMCSNVETNLSWTCLVSGLLSFEHPSVLLFCLTHRLAYSSHASMILKFWCHENETGSLYFGPCAKHLCGRLRTILRSPVTIWPHGAYRNSESQQEQGGILGKTIKVNLLQTCFVIENFGSNRLVIAIRNAWRLLVLKIWRDFTLDRFMIQHVA